MSVIPIGFCQCGCGEKTQIARCNRPECGWIKGKPIRFVTGHNARFNYGEANSHWKGGVKTRGDGYIMIKISGKYEMEHRLQAEKAMGKSLPLKAVVHHHTKTQLVICEDSRYHNLIHKRTRAYIASGHADWLLCRHCKNHDDPKNLSVSGKLVYHKSCEAVYQRDRYHNQIMEGKDG